MNNLKHPRHSGNLHTYFNARVVWMLVGFCAFIGVLSAAIVLLAVLEPNAQSKGVIQIGVWFIALSFGGMIVSWLGNRKASVTVYPDRVVFVSFPLNRKIVLPSSDISRMKLFYQSGAVSPTLAIHSSKGGRFLVTSTISDWDELLEELSVITGKEILD